LADSGRVGGVAARGRAGEKSDFFSILLGFIRRGADNRECRM